MKRMKSGISAIDSAASSPRIANGARRWRPAPRRWCR
jgi:hypothetical protein